MRTMKVFLMLAAFTALFVSCQYSDTGDNGSPPDSTFITIDTATVEVPAAVPVLTDTLPADTAEAVLLNVTPSKEYGISGTMQMSVRPSPGNWRC